MIVRSLDRARRAGDVVTESNWQSVRLLLARHDMGFSLHETTIRAGTETPMHYRNHLEAVYCVAGEGEIEDLDSGDVHAIRDGTVYALDKHDRHVLRGKTDMRMICVFNPPLTGRETHGPDGAYPAADVQARLDAEGKTAKDLPPAVEA